MEGLICSVWYLIAGWGNVVWQLSYFVSLFMIVPFRCHCECVHLFYLIFLFIIFLFAFVWFCFAPVCMFMPVYFRAFSEIRITYFLIFIIFIQVFIALYATQSYSTLTIFYPVSFFFELWASLPVLRFCLVFIFLWLRSSFVFVSSCHPFSSAMHWICFLLG